MACCLEWLAPIDNHGPPVRHMCTLSKYHDESCRCSCGAMREPRLRAVVDESPLERP
jgi:hypothetical protein